MDNLEKSISRLECIACSHSEPTTTRQFRCSRCGDLLEVRHDIERLKRLTPALRERFHARLSAMNSPYASGVWRYHELVLPDLPVDEIIALPEGNTPLYRRDKIDRYVGTAAAYVKHEGENPTLSFKDRGMTAGVSWGKHAGAKFIACASTGDTSAAMACYAAAAGLNGVVLLPHNKVSIAQLVQPISYGSKVLALDTDFDGCMALVKELTADGRIYLLNSMNPFRIEGQKTISTEALHQLNWKAPDWFVIPVGNGGNISALGKGLIELHALGLIDRLPRIAGVQVDAANPLYKAFKAGFVARERVTAKPTVASAIRIGDPVSFDKARDVTQRLSGVFIEVSDAEAMDAKAVVDAAGVNICPNSGVAVAGARKLREEGTIKPTESIVIIATAHGSKFGEAALEYHTPGTPANKLAHNANQPKQIPATLDAIRAALA